MITILSKFNPIQVLLNVGIISSSLLAIVSCSAIQSSEPPHTSSEYKDLVQNGGRLIPAGDGGGLLSRSTQQGDVGKVYTFINGIQFTNHGEEPLILTSVRLPIEQSGTAAFEASFGGVFLLGGTQGIDDPGKNFFGTVADELSESDQARIVPVAGVELPPGESARLVLTLTVPGEGEVLLPVVQVEYEAGGQTFVDLIDAGVALCTITENFTQQQCDEFSDSVLDQDVISVTPANSVELGESTVPTFPLE